jgi:prolyl oligopeptidase
MKIFRILLAVSSVSIMCVMAYGTAEESDPYVWLEELNSARAMTWVSAENAKTLGVLEKDARYPGLYADALAIDEAEDRIPTPSFVNGGIFNFWQDAAHVRGLWRRTTLEDYRDVAPVWHTVLDVDAVSAAEKANWFFKEAVCEEPRQARCLVSLSDGGEDAVTLREFDVPAGKFVESGFSLPRGKQRAAWIDDNTLLVAREWSPGQLTTSGYPFVVKQLKRGVPLSAATEVFRGKAGDGGYGVEPTSLRDGSGHTMVFVTRPLSTFEAETYVMTPKGLKRLAIPLKSVIECLIDGQLIVSLNQDWKPSSNTPIAQGTLVALDLAAVMSAPEHLKPTVIYQPGPRETFGAAAVTRDTLIVTTLENVKGRAFLYRRGQDGQWSRSQVHLPDNATVGVANAELTGDHAFLSVSSFLQPSTLYLVDAKTGTGDAVKTLSPKFDATRDTVEQFEAVSTDGTQIPYFVVHPQEMKYDGANPTLMTAYGGFQISETPRYSGTTGKLWLEKGGVFVLANIRGGGEFGPAWHEAGLKTHRQRIYDDFVAVARDLIARRITSPRHLGIAGGSNGGLLMGVQFTQHPELWNAVDIQVPLLDMLRFEHIQAGTSWVGEYGSISVPEERAFLASISPYNNIHRGRTYPEPLIWTTTKDDRVGPQHARKFAARLAEYGIPYLYYEVTEGGHGSGANLKEQAHTTALEMTYFFRKLVD